MKIIHTKEIAVTGENRERIEEILQSYLEETAEKDIGDTALSGIVAEEEVTKEYKNDDGNCPYFCPECGRCVLEDEE